MALIHRPDGIVWPGRVRPVGRRTGGFAGSISARSRAERRRSAIRRGAFRRSPKGRKHGDTAGEPYGNPSLNPLH